MSKIKDKTKKLFADKQLKEAKRHSKKASWLVIILSIVLSIILAVVGSIFIKYEFNDSGDFLALVERNYFLSVIIMILVCALQVVVALIPGEVVEIASGYAFGAWEGALYCLIGIMLGSCTVIFLTRRLGRQFIESICPREKIDSISWINDKKKFRPLVALLFFIPGTPKDLITYAIGLTKLSIPSYLLLTSVARFPSILISTLSGNALGNSNIKNAVTFFIISAVSGILGYLIYYIVSSKRSKKDSSAK